MMGWQAGNQRRWSIVNVKGRSPGAISCADQSDRNAGVADLREKLSPFYSDMADLRSTLN